MKIFVCSLATMLGLDAFAQAPAVQDSMQQPAYGWAHSVVAGLTLTQASYTDWAQGGENSLSYTASIDGKASNDHEVTSWITDYKFAFGQTRLGTQGLRKTDDKIDIATVLTYKLGQYVNPYAAATFKTQFAKGFSYDASGGATEISGFLDPAFLTQSVGAGWQISEEVKTRLGAGLREVITNVFNQYADDPATPAVEKTTVEGGFESVTNLEWKIEENIALSSQLEMFAAFKRLQEVVVRSNNTLTAKVNTYVTVIFSVQLINEKRITPRTQIKETLALGLSYALF